MTLPIPDAGHYRLLADDTLVRAVRYDVRDTDALAAWCSGTGDTDAATITIGADVAHPGDWIVKNDAGVFHIVTDGDFGILYAQATT